ncbi:hypothetical protein [Crocosphaera sp.]|uniref:hypothetical protein n=1 Tax=Crocosphaera sp. TaxID=2729996 RepID=UPI00261F5BB9|nr:hypothetical protein [Crocosphaera sp.]MDJ0582504.1 hypothetical protein [Crocosphaera sp.]
MKKISIDELEQKIEAGEEVIDRYFDASTTRVGKVYTKVSRRKHSQNKQENKVKVNDLK